MKRIGGINPVLVAIDAFDVLGLLTLCVAVLSSGEPHTQWLLVSMLCWSVRVSIEVLKGLS